MIFKIEIKKVSKESENRKIESGKIIISIINH
jgi:hypothetical protein